MADLVPADQIEQIVGATRHPHMHIGRAVSEEEIVYILHSQECKNSTPDLRDCAYSIALDRGIDPDEWVEDEPVVLAIDDGCLIHDTDNTVVTAIRGPL